MKRKQKIKVKDNISHSMIAICWSNLIFGCVLRYSLLPPVGRHSPLSNHIWEGQVEPGQSRLVWVTLVSYCCHTGNTLAGVADWNCLFMEPGFFWIGWEKQCMEPDLFVCMWSHRDKNTLFSHWCILLLEQSDADKLFLEKTGEAERATLNNCC